MESNTNPTEEKCSCGCKHNWTHRTPARIIIAIAIGVVIFSAGLVLGSHHRDFGYGYGRHGYGMMGGFGYGGMMNGGNARFFYRATAPTDQNTDVYYGGPRGMMRIQGATGTPTPGQVQNY